MINEKGKEIRQLVLDTNLGKVKSIFNIYYVL